MVSVLRTNLRFLLMFLTVVAAIVLSFVLFEQSTSQWITSVANQLTTAAQSPWLIAFFIVAVLAFDVILPIPSSVVAVFAATTLGFFAGAFAIWLGLMLGAWLGYLIGASSQKFLLNHWVNNDDLVKAKGLTDKLGAGSLVILRGVPVLAETSVIAAGLVRYPLIPFLLITAMANAGLAMAYGYVGSQAGANNSFMIVVGGSITIPAIAWLLKYVWENHRPRLGVLNGQDSGDSKLSETVTTHNMQAKSNEVIPTINAGFQVSYRYPVIFESNVFSPSNTVLKDLLILQSTGRQGVFIFIDSGIVKSNSSLNNHIKHYFQEFSDEIHLLAEPEVIIGGEAVKCREQIDLIYRQLLDKQLDRHSCVLVIGGGAVLDAVGFACATFHRGIKLLRMPSTVLAQNDAGVGVKNGINAFDTKNLVGSFAPPMAVLNDNSLLTTLSIRDRRAGLAEAVKVAAIRDAGFFQWMEANVEALRHFEESVSQMAIARCAQLHIKQVTGTGDPFETGNARPLDYGHWSAHKLEAIAGYTIRHGEAVAIGMCLDARYAVNTGLLQEAEAQRLITLLGNLGFDLWHVGMEQKNEQGEFEVLTGLEEFRQHLGGELCITLLSEIGVGMEVNNIQLTPLLEALAWLKQQHHIQQHHLQ